MLLSFPERKKVRSRVLARFVREAGYPGVVVFTCGNSAAALRDEGLSVVEVGPKGSLLPAFWWKPAEIRRTWPNLFDATSGHIPIPLLVEISDAFREFLGPLPGSAYDVPTGSGETIVALRLAYPWIHFSPVYGLGPETAFEARAPMNRLVDPSRW